MGEGDLLKFFNVINFLYICTFIHSCGKYLDCYKHDNFCDSGCRGLRLGIREYLMKLSNTFGTVGGGTWGGGEGQV